MLSTLKNIKHVFREFTQVFAWPDISHQTTEEIVRIGWDVLPHTPYSPDLAPSDLHLFGPLKESHSGNHLEDEETVNKSVCHSLKKQGYAFNIIGIDGLVKRLARTMEKRPINSKKMWFSCYINCI